MPTSPRRDFSKDPMSDDEEDVPKITWADLVSVETFVAWKRKTPGGWWRFASAEDLTVPLEDTDAVECERAITTAKELDDQE